ncbi:AAA family ATPase [Polyangium spumosum]|nr:ATP-binding protein [Polyangium spumosum]
MTRPWDISTEEIQQWASKFEAPSLLPKLLRRLLLATTPLMGIEMRADAGVRYSGWDGIVRARASTPFCPAGLSVWELSVEKKVRKKLDDDYNKRTEEPTKGVRPSLTTYVAVTARAFPGKDAWAQEKRESRDWADVRLLDADDIATWIEQAPAVARWLANVLGRPAYDCRDVDAFLDDWSKRTTPPLPRNLVLAGERRAAQGEELSTWLDSNAGPSLLVRGRTREEAALFAAAAIARGPKAETWLSRAVVVETEDAFRWALRAQGAESQILLPVFDRPDAGQAIAAKARIILPSDSSVPPQKGSTLTLEEQPFAPLAKALEGAGFSEQDAERHIRAAGGDLTSLQYRLGYINVQLPDWARNSPRAELLALLLVGAWVPTQEGDREVVRRLGGDPAVAEQLCADLPSTVMMRVTERVPQGVYRWTSPETAFKLLTRGLTETHLACFRDVVMVVLGTPDPAYELPKAERYMAAIKGKVTAQSDALRLGLAESIARLALEDETFAETHHTRSGSVLAEGLVRWLLRPEAGWLPWASLHESLPILAEAAPNGFLDRVESSLDRQDEGVGHLFQEEQVMFGSSPHTGLLWALEVLAWHPEERVRSRVIRALTRLDAMDPGGAMANRPLQSLDALLRYVMPKSNTTTEERIKLIRQVFQQCAQTGRKLGLGMLEKLRGGVLLNQGRLPQFHDWAPKEDSDNIDMRVVSAQVLALLEDLANDAGDDGHRWADLVRSVLRGPEDVEEQVLEAILTRRDTIDDAEGILWTALRKALTGLDEQDLASERVKSLEKLYDGFTPKDFARAHAWRFEPYQGIPLRPFTRATEDEQALDELRAETISELWKSEDRWALLAKLLREVEKSNYGVDSLGWSLGKSPHSSDVEPRILADTPEEPYAALIASFSIARARKLGLSWLEKLLRRFIDLGRIADAARVAARWDTGKPLWALLEQMGEPLQTEYWKSILRVFGKPSIEELEYAVDHFLAVGREAAALETAAIHRSTTTGTLAYRVLLRVKETGATLQAPLGAHYVEWLFDVIDRDPPAGKDPVHDIAPLEFYFLLLISDKRRTRYVTVALAENTDIFVALVRNLYRREGEESPTGTDPAKVQSAQNAYALLKAWKGFPGEGLPENERDDKLEAWAAEVLTKTEDDGRGRVGSVHVAEVLARAPAGSDGFWPCIAARRLLESGRYTSLSENLALAKRNLRGMTARDLDEGGVQEREIADRYREASQKLEMAGYPRTSAMLDALARRYEEEADREDAEARRFRIEHGERIVADDAPPTPREATSTEKEFVSQIVTTGVGPAPRFEVPLRPRMNLLIGDNSLGKTFVLEVLWWALTGAWSDEPARPPSRRRNGRPVSTATISAKAGGRDLIGEYDPAKERWKKKGSRALAPGLGVYARADGSFSVWDPIRNRKPTDKGQPDLSRGYHFAPRELWRGLNARDGSTVLCRGLLEDIVSWRSERRSAYAALEKVIEKLSPPEEPIRFGLPKRLRRLDTLNHPTLDLGYDANVFAIHASAAVKRVLGLAYALVWAVSEIQEVAPLAGLAPLRRVTLLCDEVESHLHPRWQRTILPAILAAMEALAPQAEVQFIVTTHAPLVLASLEPSFDPVKDNLLEFQQNPSDKTVRVVEEPWQRFGDANTWLVEHFGLKHPRSKEAEDAIERAARAIENPKTSRKAARAIDKKLLAVLRETDPFLARWRYITGKRGWLP